MTDPFKLYVYEVDGYHRGGQWFRKSVRYPDEEIIAAVAKEMVDKFMHMKREIRICDGGDMLVFHAKKGKVIYPGNPKEWWESLT